MKNIINLLFLTIGTWKLKHSNDKYIKTFSFLETKERNQITTINYFISKKTYIYDEVNNLLISEKKSCKYSIIENKNELIMIDLEKSNYYIYEKEAPKNKLNNSDNLFIILVVMNIYNLLLSNDIITLLIRNIMSTQNHM